jgi:PAS domain S-box-containing protein
MIVGGRRPPPAVLASTVTADAGASRSPPRAHRQRRAAHARAQRPAAARPGLPHLSIGLISNTLFWMVVALSVLTVWMLLGTWRHMRRRAQIQGALVQETNFRRAMENSMPTGMRAMDLEGRITYVNAAFCQMTGFTEAELVGRLPPFPYWPPDRIDENGRLLQQELQGRSPDRRHRGQGDAQGRVALRRAHVRQSPLIDPKGQQTGWMTSMTNITEAKRIRDQLSARTSASPPCWKAWTRRCRCCRCSRANCCSPTAATGCGSAAMPAATAAGRRRGKRLDFEPETDDSVDNLSGLPTQELTEAGANPREVYVESLQKWFDVRARYLQWTDGRLAQMLIATDITARLRAEEQAAAQAEKAQVTSRLVTMGEMASSVAHELNQPLTAITNYCNGMVSRVKGGTIEGRPGGRAAEDRAPGRTAGQIIHRIRAFVKRSEPQRQAGAGAADRRRRGRTGRHRAAPPQRGHPHLRGAAPAHAHGRPDPDRAGAAEPAEERRRGHRRRPAGRRAPPHRAARGAAPHARRRRRDRVQRHRHGPGPEGRSHGRLYEAFFSTKAEGLGIGLSLCRSIVESHRGRMKAQNLYNGARSSAAALRSRCRWNCPSGTDPAASPRSARTPSRTHGRHTE